MMFCFVDCVDYGLLTAQKLNSRHKKKSQKAARAKGYTLAYLKK